jgi:single-strand DNA-binding protein
MSGVNKAILVGHLGGDPEIRKTQSGKEVCNFSIATGESWRDKTTGERKEHTDWHRVVILNEALVKIAGAYLKKGSKVYLEGQMKTRKWTDKSNIERYVTEVVLGPFHSALTLLDKREGVPPADETSYGGAAAGPAPGGKPDDHDEIPF